MADKIDAKAEQIPVMVPPTSTPPFFIQRCCELLGQQVTVNLNAGPSPAVGMLYAVGKDYIELHTAATTTATASNTITVVIIPLSNIAFIIAAGSMQLICPGPPAGGYPVSPYIGLCPGYPGGHCPPAAYPGGYVPTTGYPPTGYVPPTGYPGF